MPAWYFCPQQSISKIQHIQKRDLCLIVTIESDYDIPDIPERKTNDL